jgi:hypothetical protein
MEIRMFLHCQKNGKQKMVLMRTLSIDSMPEIANNSAPRNPSIHSPFLSAFFLCLSFYIMIMMNCEREGRYSNTFRQ